MTNTTAADIASAGCGQNLHIAINSGGGYLGGGYCGGNSLPSSNVVERDIVFGGEERLREQIKSTLFSSFLQNCIFI